MFTLLDDLDCAAGKDALSKCRELADRVTYQRTFSSPPADFMRFAPQAYLKALQSENYYFSCEELLWLAECANSNVIIARFRGCSLLVEGSELGGQGPVAVILLQGDGRRSHFERLCPQAWVPEVEKAMYLGSMGYAAHMTTDFEESNCLIEAILCALHSQGYLIQKSAEERKNICRRVRHHLVDCHSLAAEGYPRLSHVDHFRPIIDYLFRDVPEIWRRSEGGDQPTIRDRLVITAEVHELWRQ